MTSGIVSAHICAITKVFKHTDLSCVALSVVSLLFKHTAVNHNVSGVEGWGDGVFLGEGLG